MQQISCNGQPVAMAGRERVWLIGELKQLDPKDPVGVFAMRLCLLAPYVLGGTLLGPFAHERAESFARTAPMSADDLLAVAYRGELEIAQRLYGSLGQATRGPAISASALSEGRSSDD